MTICLFVLRHLTLSCLFCSKASYFVKKLLSFDTRCHFYGGPPFNLSVYGSFHPYILTKLKFDINRSHAYIELNSN